MSQQEIDQLFNRALAFSFAGKSDRGRHAADLQIAARREAVGQDEIVLTREQFTPGMRAMCIQPVNAALAQWREVRDRYRSAVRPLWQQFEDENSPGVEKNKIITAAEADIAKIREVAQADSRYAAASGVKNATEHRYENLVAKHGREPRTFSPFAYVVMLLSLGVAEWFINYSTFRGAYGVPVVAGGFTFVVAAGFAFASHFHGTYLRQYHVLFGEHVPPAKRRLRYFTLVFFSLFVILGLAFVAWSRYAWAMEEMQNLVGGQSGSPFARLSGSLKPNIELKVFMSTAGNIIVWLLGIAVAWQLHDEDPEFPAARKDRDKALKVFTGLHRPVERQIRSVEAERDRKLAQAGNVSSAQKDVADRLRGQRERLNEHEKGLLKGLEIQALSDVRDYQHFFCAEALAKNKGLRLNKGGELISVAAYQNLELAIDGNALTSAVA